MDNSGTANDVARAILTALGWNSSSDDRKSAMSYLESVKAGDVRVLASTSFVLVKKEWSSEVRLHAFKLLQHLVRLRWDELTPEERREFANVSIDLMNEIANSCEEWALKSQTAALIAEIVRREGLSLWQELVPSLVSLSSSGPTHAEMVCMMLRWLPEDITVHNEDLEGDRRRLLLRGLTESLPDILPLLYTLLERHFGAAMTEAGRQQLDIAKQHAAAVTATLNAINAYAEWAPLPYLSKYGTIHGCGFLLSSPDFRLHACEFFKLVSSRKRPVDADSDFDSAMSSILVILMNASTDFLNRSESGYGVINDSDYEFAECICESLVALGSTNLQCITGDNERLSLYLQKMVQYFKHYKLELHYQSLIFWLALMRDLLSKPKTSVGDGSVDNLTSGSGQADNQKRMILPFVNDEICSIMLDISFQRMLKKEKANPGNELSGGALELWGDDFEGKGDFGQYRSKLLELIRLIASFKPLIAVTKVSDTVILIIKNLLLSPLPSGNLAILESMQLALENVLGTVFDGPNDDNGSGSDAQLASCRVLEGLLQQLLSLKWTEPEFVEVLGHYLEALGPFLKYYADAVGSVINKLFELLTSLPIVMKDPSTSRARHARLQICTSFIRLAKTADSRLLPHMKGIADTVAYLQKEGQLLRGEHNIFGEAFLIIASAAGSQQQQEVMTWLLEPLSNQWTQLEWQNSYLSDPAGLVKLCAETQFMWSLFHTVTFFEKALKRSGVRKGNTNINNSIASSIPSHPLASHLPWMLPPLLKLLRAIHSLWSPPVTQLLPGQIKAAMIMSDFERTSLLGESNPKVPKSAITFADGFHLNMKDGNGEPNEIDIRNWLKGIRESGYNVLGLSTTVGDSFFRCTDIEAIDLALMENIGSMEFRHMRQLVHSILIPLVKNCPTELWDVWLKRLLYPLFEYSHQALRCSWSGLLDEGRAKVPDLHGILGGSDLKVEVMEEKLLRDLTREICSLLSVLGSPGLNCGLHSEQSGHGSRSDVLAPKDSDVMSSSVVGFLLKNKDIAIPVLHLCLDAFRWTDGEATIKVASFCGAVVLLAISTDNVELRQFVCKDLFSAIIQGLALESNAFTSADLVGLCREIFVNFCTKDPAPRQILLSLPCIAHQDLVAFEEALGKTSSPKEQKQLMKSFLLVGTGNKLKALAIQKSVNVITNVVARPRSSVSVPDSRTEDGGAIGLAAIV
ncbi:protein HASTY 1 isoform X1 [Cynara cardunculus var. scolymus]|uniref:protein HASTY 1 isoform X1 n=1 Tax=Cynara cardunculus var. scolymus TaxID=59895 RepID=UPI000D62BFB5|nr:protein HASTY 1 isoform X1 [Cynara cardunculus var. scolymus]